MLNLILNALKLAIYTVKRCLRRIIQSCQKEFHAEYLREKKTAKNLYFLIFLEGNSMRDCLLS